MSSRRVIPPLKQSVSSPEEVLGSLGSRLQKTESDTKLILQQLSDIGFKASDIKSRSTEVPPQEGTTTISPYQPRFIDAEVLHKNYETLVSRVCRTESTIQTLKLTICNLQAEKEISSKESTITTERLAQVKEAYEAEVAKRQTELVWIQKEYKEELASRETAESNVSKLQQSLDIEVASKVELQGKVDDMTASTQKLTRRVSDLKDELVREKHMCTSLEESHNMLLTRIHQLEEVVEHERKEVKTLSSDCSVLRKQGIQLRGDSTGGQRLRGKLSQQIEHLTKDRDKKDKLMKSLEEDKNLLMGEIGKIQVGYTDLNKQLENMQQLFTDHRETHLQLEQENESLNKALEAAIEERTRMAAQFEQQLQAEKEEWVQEMNEQGVERINQEMDIKNTLYTQLEKKCSKLEKQLSSIKSEWVLQDKQHTETASELEEKLRNVQNELNTEANSREQFEQEVTSLTAQLSEAKQKAEQALTDKENLLDEVNQAVDGMSTEKTRLESDLQQAVVEVQNLTSINSQLEQENSHLLERVSSLEETEGSHQQMNLALSQLVEQKNKIAYEKGQLQARVEQLETQLKDVMATQGGHVKKSNQSLQAKYIKSQNEVSSLKVNIQRLEAQLRHQQSVCDQKEQDFSLAIQARNEALREIEELKGQLGMLEERDRFKIEGLHRTIEDSKADKSKLSTTVQSVMTSYTQLQAHMEDLQTDLGSKDKIIEQLKQQRSQSQGVIHGLQKEMDTLQAKLTNMEAVETNEIEPLRKSLQKSRSDNVKMASTLEELLQANVQLQNTLQTLQDDLNRKNRQIEKLESTRWRDQADMKKESSLLEERLDSMMKQLQSSKDEAARRNQREIIELKKTNDELLSKNGELSRSNKSLRQHINDLESQLQEEHKKLSTTKGQIDHLQKLRKQHELTISQLKTIHADVEDLERVKNEYIRKNHEQASLIQKFMSEIASLQSELQSLARMQLETSHIVEEQQQQINTSKDYNESLKKKYKLTKQRQQELEDLRIKTEEKLQEAQNESMQISSNLNDAHHWFKSKFENLQTELLKSRQSQEELERAKYEQQLTIEEEKRRAEDVAKRAQHMITASRKAMHKLTDHAEFSELETKRMVDDLQKQLLTEREHAKYMENKYNQLKEASARRVEDLLQDIGHKQYPYDGPV